jgi:integrase
MATIRKRGTKYQVQVRRKGLRSINHSFHTLKDAQTWARHIEVRADRQDLPPDHNQLKSLRLADLVVRYLDSITPLKRTAQGERIALKAFLRRPICGLRLSDLSVADFARYRDERLKVIKPSSLARELTPIRHMFEIARKEWGLPIRSNPLTDLSIPDANTRRERRLREGELSCLIREADNSRNPYLAPLILFALVTGMRRGEILAMKWHDLDVAASGLLIPSSKNGHARVIPLIPEALKIVTDLPRTSGRVFPLSGNAVRLAWSRLLKRTGIDDLHFHDLRHEAISSFFEAGLSAPEVALISGHRDPRMLFRYTHPTRERILKRLSQQAVPRLTVEIADDRTKENGETQRRS